MQHVFLRHFAVFEENRRGRAAVDAHLVLFVARLEPGEGAFHDERRELLAVDLREHDVHVGEPAVGDPHFLPVQDVMRAFLVQFRARQRILGIGTGLRLGEAICADPFAGRQLWQIFFLLRFRAEVHDRQRPDAGVRAVRHREPAVNRELFRQHRRRDLIEPRAAVFFRNSAAHEAHFSGFFHERGHQSGLFVFQVLHQRQNFLHHKFFSRLPHQLLIVGQISGRKHVARLRRFQQEAASLCCRLGQGRGGHSGFS